MKFEIDKIPPSSVYKLLVGLVAPRPIALITSLDENGKLNAAPFSAYNYLCTDPPIVGIGISNRSWDGKIVPKDTAKNIMATGEFVVNVVSESIAHQMVICSTEFPPEVNELEMAKFSTTPSQIVKVPRIMEAPAALECKKHSVIEVGKSRIILGQVVSIYVDDKFIDPAGPYVKADQLHSIGRMNGLGNYVKTRDAFFSIPRISLEEWEKQHGK
jgi:flavin reductase (DIM6/NTAB) family NADH-FMN oxidoreductase RutF